MRIIKVKGNSTMSVEPTLMLISVETSGIEKEFGDAVTKSSQNTEKIKKIMEKLNFDRKEIKTSNFSINSEFESYMDKDENYKSRFVGFKYEHEMKISFPINNEIFGQIVFGLVESKLEPRFSISYTIEDEEKENYRNELIKNSVRNAIERAKVLAEASNVELGEILTIDYSDKGINFTKTFSSYSDYNFMTYEHERSTAYKFDFEADDIKIDDSVHMVFEIK